MKKMIEMLWYRRMNVNVATRICYGVLRESRDFNVQCSI